MPARRDSAQPRPVLWLAKDAEVGGLGIDWLEVPEDVASAPVALAEWERLAVVYRDTPVRFRRGDQAALSQYCISVAIVRQAAAELLEAGVLVDGRSRTDKGRKVKSPAMTVWVAASGQLRFWARELGLSPDARARQGIREADGASATEEERDVFGIGQ